MSLLLHIRSKEDRAPFCGALVLDEERDRVIEASPSLRFMRAWTLNQVRLYVNRQNLRMAGRGEHLE